MDGQGYANALTLNTAFRPNRLQKRQSGICEFHILQTPKTIYSKTLSPFHQIKVWVISINNSSTLLPPCLEVYPKPCLSISHLSILKLLAAFLGGVHGEDSRSWTVAPTKEMICHFATSSRFTKSKKCRKQFQPLIPQSCLKNKLLSELECTWIALSSRLCRLRLRLLNLLGSFVHVRSWGQRNAPMGRPCHQLTKYAYGSKPSYSLGMTLSSEHEWGTLKGSTRTPHSRFIH